MDVLMFDQVEKRDQDAVVIPRFDLNIESGRVVAIQSNLDMRKRLLNVLLGRERLTDGSVRLMGEPITTARSKEIGFVFTEDGLYERLKTKDHLKFHKRLYQSDKTIEEIAGRLKLEDDLHRRVDKLSFSKKKRLSIAKVMFQSPDLIVLEEPDQNVDLEMKQLLILLIEELREEQKAVLILTNHMESASAYTDDVCRMSTEGVIQIGPEDDTSFSPIKLNKVTAKLEDKLLLFDPSEIDFFESNQGQVLLYGNGEHYPCPSTLADLEKRLSTFGFFRCHRSYLVNLQRVREIVTWSKNSYSLNLSDASKSQIPLSKNKLSELKEILSLS
ncbi:LytTR family transcriptional regulator DNA-binding domain-containing protein [Halobacillus litoralis]|uniref:LytTR family transcriptional regulator DNA-binding domain-containing protein n=1 Tax=Halobacillus litoralis TaxID=45668 RepID=UPI001CD77F82|nr:LytTR family transcriptional regulator DNA-binding domain-containing protein [Halobacillus litoralis]MCA0970543.1 LytTR family transcriptional regulator DNA-binding domain-containing protein [Halobacillus litoralis]